jgi:hypothetical protein
MGDVFRNLFPFVIESKPQGFEPCGNLLTEEAELSVSACFQ